MGRLFYLCVCVCAACFLALQLIILSVGGQAFCGAITRYNHSHKRKYTRKNKHTHKALRVGLFLPPNTIKQFHSKRLEDCI